MHIVSRTWLKS